MDKTYNPDQIEARWYPYWEDKGCFKPSGEGEPFTILLPPPNVTGTLHMGHAFQHTLMDALIRYQRLKGRDTLWQVGVDHAGIATEMVVTRQIEAEGGKRDDYTREEFIEKVWDWKEHSGSTITSQMRRLGASADWSRERFTMNPDLSEAVNETFVRLFEEGKIYRGPRLVNWDPVLKTAISDLEVVNSEEQGKLWSIRYPRTDGEGDVIVATTRPETLLGDVCVAVHPDDDRYADLVGKTVELPLTDRQIPVVADEYVDMEFGTGCVKITPAHDFNDWEVGSRHDFEPINIFTPTAEINDNAPEAYRGLDRFEARKRVIEDLKAQDLLVEEKPHTLMVPRGDRSGQVIEPYLTDQWFVKMDELGKIGLDAVESGEVEFVPGNWINTYRHWMENLQDWCISRQLWWGHRIPAWYDEDGNVHVGRTEDEARANSDLPADAKLTQDEDVLETWFSSALWAHSTLGWPNEARMNSEGFDRYLPTSVLITGFDIIFFWVARMIMMTKHFTGEVPFEQVYITGLIRDRDGQKMSKSKGNVLDPIDLIDGIDLESLVDKRTASMMQPQKAKAVAKATREEYPDGIPAFGADALRFTFTALAGHGRDIKFDLGRCEGYRNFLNKLWNAARFTLMNTGEEKLPVPAEGDYDVLSRWIRSALGRTINEVDAALADYRFDLAAKALYEFVWHEFCDWYLELAKPALAEDADEATARATRHTLATVLEATLKLLHPFVPFITEEIWQRVRIPAGVEAETIMATRWPEAGAIDEAAEQDAEWLKTVISAIRSARTELGLAPGKPMPLMVQLGGDDDHERLERFGSLIRRLARIESIERVSDDRDSGDCAVALAGNLRLLIPLAGLVDIGEEVARLNKQLEREQKGLAQAEKKLANERFVDNAPAEVVDKERQRLEEHKTKVCELSNQIDKLSRLQ
ncbi:valine--tRNA ligase [Wenzhouxiangella sediminis]|uniref:Valine--tRNA ligase n=1 Tax=Wenzhouxiangella sediminis TaxID=1792836 RepID=A0A3E1K899_9GAMM|nr:valine--tRNA ligase [Wenzhouxiangella sediminis]RFF30294.1 valine--tRNA ligase [Wenzhouxiangella sediminis]